MADILRDTFDLTLRQNKVVFQQKKPLLNYELNLVQDILNTKIENLQKLAIANSYSGDSLSISPGSLPNEIVINKGVFFHKGTPLTLTYNQTLVCSAAPTISQRVDVVYAEWFLSEVDSFVDPNIGFATSRQEEVNFQVKIAYNVDPAIGVPAVDETITFNSLNNLISLAVGTFPNWLTIPGTKFKTNSKNSGAPYLTVVSSPNPQTIIVSGGLVDDSLSNVTFFQWDNSGSGAVPKSFQAYRKNILLLAEITRQPSVQTITSSDIKDLRDQAVYNFVNSGCAVSEYSNPGFISVKVQPGEATVADQEFFVEAAEPFLNLTPNALNYVYLTASGVSAANTTEPTIPHLLLAQVWTDASGIVSIEDKRDHVPFAWSNKYDGGEGTGQTGFPTINIPFSAAENIARYECVYLSGSGEVSRASAANATTLPAIGIAPFSISSGQTDNIVLFGEISNPAWSWTPGEDIFVSSAFGGLINSTGVTVLATGTYVQRVGVAVSSTKILFKPELTTVRIDSTAEVPLIKIGSDGQLSVMGVTDKIFSDRQSFLAPIEIQGTSSFSISPGRYFTNDPTLTQPDFYFPGAVINMGPTGTPQTSGGFQTTAIPSGFVYNNAFFTVDGSGTVHMYEGTPSVTVPTKEPAIPANEMPICLVTFQDTGGHTDGSIATISQTDILDKRSWINIGNSDHAALKPIFKDLQNILIQKGSIWINGRYFSLNNQTVIPADFTSLAGKYYIYVDITNSSVNIGDGVLAGGAVDNNTLSSLNFTISSSAPNNVDKRLLIPIGTYEAIWFPNFGMYGVVQDSVNAYESKFWKYRDTPYVIEDGVVCEQTFSVSTSASSFYISNFSFLSTDFLDVKINGIEYYEDTQSATNDWTKNPVSNTVYTNFVVKPGASVKIRKV